MPEKTQAIRAKAAKKKGTTMALKATDVGAAGGMSTHRAKKKGGKMMGEVEFSDRSVSPRKPPGRGLTTKSRKLPVPELGSSSTSRTKTIPVEAAAGYRKDGTRKKTTGRGDTPPLKASKKLLRPSKKTGRH